MKQKARFYCDTFHAAGKVLLRAAALVKRRLEGWGEDGAQEIQNLRSEGVRCRDRIERRLYDDFLPPVEREELCMLVLGISEVGESLLDLLQMPVNRSYRTEICLDMACALLHGCEELNACVLLLLSSHDRKQMVSTALKAREGIFRAQQRAVMEYEEGGRIFFALLRCLGRMDQLLKRIVYAGMKNI